jgi:hypothetical protein
MIAIEPMSVCVCVCRREGGRALRTGDGRVFEGWKER